jgi:excisionase family DNA binding protein
MLGIHILIMYTISQAAAYLGISVVTLRRWDSSKHFVAIRTIGDHRCYSIAQLDAYLGIESEIHSLDSPKATRIPYIYSRVSSEHQAKAGNLQRQADRLVNNS